MRYMETVINGRRVYYSVFDEKTGALVRGVEEIDNGYSQLTSEIYKLYPHRYRQLPSPSPELCDISITNQCSMGCPYCYQDSKSNLAHGRKELVGKILRGFKYMPYQIAIGGGEPTQHPDFPWILRLARELGTVPNYTTAGFHMTPEIIEATNEVCGGVAMTYHAFRGFDWFKRHYQDLRKQLKVKLNVHLIANRDVVTNLKQLVANRDALGDLSIVLLAYYPDVGRGSADGLMDRKTYMQDFPEAIQYALTAGVGISFSEGLIPYFLSRPSLGMGLDMLTASEGRFSCYFDSNGRMSMSSFDPPQDDEPTVFEKSSQEMWDQLYAFKGSPEGVACYACPQRRRCNIAHDSHYLICAHAEHNHLPLASRKRRLDLRTCFDIINEDNEE